MTRGVSGIGAELELLIKTRSTLRLYFARSAPRPDLGFCPFSRVENVLPAFSAFRHAFIVDAYVTSYIFTRVARKTWMRPLLHIPIIHRDNEINSNINGNLYRVIFYRMYFTAIYRNTGNRYIPMIHKII